MADVAATGLKAEFLKHRTQLLAFFHRRAVPHAAEDLLQEMWLRLPSDDAHIDAPLAYLYRIADSLVIDRYRREMQERKRDREWFDTAGAGAFQSFDQPGADRAIAARQAIAETLQALNEEGERVFRIFYRHRVDGLTQREVAVEMGVSVGTVEGDLRRAYRVLAALRSEK